MILINSGPSDRGFHRLESWLRCPQLYAWGYGRKGAARFPPRLPLVRGNLVHVGLAHSYARAKAVQEGRDPADYYPPLEAVELASREFPPDLVEQASLVVPKVLRAYVQHYGTEPYRIVAVEEQREMEFFGYRYTARVDLEIEDAGGKVWWLDHKTCNKIESKVFDRYTLSGQFLGLQHLGFKVWGEKFGGVLLNLLGCAGTPTFAREAIEAAPWALERFPWIVKHAEEGIAATEALLARGEPVPMAVSEHVCMTSYGRCPAHDLCRLGDLTFIDQES